MISIIIPTYNRADLLPRALKSVIAQTYRDWECIVVDDGSTDATQEVLQEFVEQDSRIRAMHQTNAGQGAARNAGIRVMRGDYIAFLDSDDEWLPEKLTQQVAVLTKEINADFCYTADIVRYDDGHEEIKRYTNITSEQLSFMKLASIGISVPSSHMYRKTAFESIGLFNERRELIGLEDNEWSIRGAKLIGMYIDIPLTAYYVHTGQITRSAALQQAQGLMMIMSMHIHILMQHPKALGLRAAQLMYTRIKTYIPESLRSRLRNILTRT